MLTLFAPLVLALAVQAPVMPAAAAEGPVIVTTGEGVVKMAPDRAWVTIAAESRAKSPREAQRANADAMKAVLDKLKALGLPSDAIRTAGYDLQPQFDYVNGKQSLRDYLARNTIEYGSTTLHVRATFWMPPLDRVRPASAVFDSI
jgi:uncharacterized protein YggE